MKAGTVSFQKVIYLKKIIYTNIFNVRTGPFVT